MAVDRAYIPGGRVGEARAALEDLSRRITALFESAGAMRVEPAALHHAERLLDVYGEDLRARAFTVEQLDRSESFLRPDFTMPVLDLHRIAQADPARYAYCGPVWRRQDFGAKRPTEFLQAGVEIYGEDEAGADAETFTLIRDALAEGGMRAPEIVTGDLGLAFALLDAIPMSERRRAALRRHFWRPARFQDLVKRFSRPAPAPGGLRVKLLRAEDAEAFAAEQGQHLGARGLEDIAMRAKALQEDAREAPMALDDAKLIDAVLAVAAPAGAAHAAIAGLASEAGRDLTAALDRFARRLDALQQRGIDAASLPFRANFGRTLEYYDGFVFEFRAPERDDLPPLAAGGRYDGMAAALGLDPTPAVGGMVRPEALMAATC